MAGWFAGADILKSGFPGMVGMKVNTALCLIVSVATWLLVEVRDGDATLGQLRRAASEGEPFESVSADMHMPGLTGMELARTVRSEPKLRATQLILLSSAIDDRVIARRAGFDFHLPKPYDALLCARRWCREQGA